MRLTGINVDDCVKPPIRYCHARSVACIRLLEAKIGSISGLWTTVTALCYDVVMGCPKPIVFNVGLVSSLIVLGCAGRPAAPGESIGRSPDLGSGDRRSDAGGRAVDASAPLAAGDVHFDAGVEDPSRLMTEADRDQVNSPSSAGPVGGSGLMLHVAERGPDKPWIIAVSNEGPTPAVLVADTRLLWLEVQVPGSKKISNCRLPVDLLPKDAEPRLNIRLVPGESVAQLIDPRLYCFASGEQKTLVPGARVVPHLGWPELPNKANWEKGKKVTAPVPQPPPFVAHHADVDIESAVQARAAAIKVTKAVRPGKGIVKPSDAALGVPLPVGVDKQLLGPELTLRDTYSQWASAKRKAAGNPEESPLDLQLVQGSDARTEHNATVELTLRNRSKRRVIVYFRREFVTYEVVGPAGVVTCDPAPDTRAPEREAFVTLAPGASRSFSSRLAEMCPRDTFDMPGLYIVNAKYDATEPGTQWNLAAFTGSVASDRPANVRIRIGELSILRKVQLRKLDETPAQASGSVSPGDAGSASVVAPGR